jgi:hypothetical protein
MMAQGSRPRAAVSAGAHAAATALFGTGGEPDFCVQPPSDAIATNMATRAIRRIGMRNDP